MRHFFLGNYAQADFDESNQAVEALGLYNQSFGSAGAPLADEEVLITFDDASGNSAIEVDYSIVVPGGEPVSYTLGGTPVNTVVDSLVVADAFVTYLNGDTASFSNVVLFQDATGNMWLTNSNFAGTDLNHPGGSRIQQVTISIADDGTAGGQPGYDGLFHLAMQDFVCIDGAAPHCPAGQAAPDLLCACALRPP